MHNCIYFFIELMRIFLLFVIDEFGYANLNPVFSVKNRFHTC
ncbi:Uncharacterized protein dnm_082860 [Desulfonema magnum]|uniref:Uncharacterized protein n=1 Tax=Desulfonema magnum TaxID=45655 RepID=A0A975BUS9_9BACT|nr:Uncharacterized protein dnm_082860 [Desulfonema magnum]